MTVPAHERLAVALQERYRIERRSDGSLALLGRGGTATVYLAHDLRHDRPVALKVVHPELAASVGTERFLREIRFVARLSHPHILPLFDSGEAEGLLYYVMPYVPGESLRQRLERDGRLPVTSAVRIACQVGLALDYAHRHGVVHRDIKPENILLDGDEAIVADFGIATAREAASDERLTEAGLAVGTPAYMSPEQAGGAPQVDGRSDIYSLGCVLYEMLGGAPPFTGPTPQAVMAQQVLATLSPIRARREDVPEAVEHALAKALAKEPADRFATAAELTAALEGSATTPPPLPAAGRATRRRTAALLGVGAVAATAFLFALGLQRQQPEPNETARIAVLPFDNLGAAEDDYFADGITEEITSRLAMIPTLGVISRTSAEQYRGTDKSIREIGRELGVAYILEGSVRWEKSAGGSRVRVTPQLIRVSDDRHLWAGRFDETLEEVFDVQSRIAEQVAAELDLALRQPEHEALAAKPTENLQAYDFYLRGNDLLAKAGDPEAVLKAERMYVQATEHDPEFALAFARLARSRIWQFHFSDRTVSKLAAARAAVDSALALDPALPEAHLALGQVHYWGELDYEAALREFRLAHAGDPGNGDIAWARGLVERRLGQWDQALASLRKAVELDPRSVVKHMDVFEVYLRQRQYGAAEQYVERALALQPDAPIYVFKAMLVVTRDGDLEAATRVLEEGARKAGLQNLAAWTAQYDLGAALWHRLPDSAQKAVDGVTMTMVGADSAGYYLLKARMQRLRGNGPASRAYFDSAASVLEGRTASRPEDPALHADLGFAYAGLGRREDAMREGRRAVELRPPSKDTWLGVDMLRSLAITYATLGEADSAVKQLRVLLQVPSWISVPALRSDPTWDPIRRDPGFRALIAEEGRVGGVAVR
jgi:TolB-like protein/Tfp pilus assembly protein PilF/tRNA A-37 threonylcarbamoyl transferase component Bud32